MPTMSPKAVIWALVIIVLLSQIDKIVALLRFAGLTLCGYLAPLQHASEPVKALVALLALAVVAAIVVRLLNRKM